MSKNHYKESKNITSHTSVPWQQDILEDFLDIITEKNGNSMVVDVGTGIGNNIETLLCYSQDITAIDISKYAIDRLKESYKNKDLNIKALTINAQSLPYKSNLFDIVVCTETFEHCESPEKVFAESVRVLKRGGYAIFSIPNYFNPSGAWKMLYEFIYPEKVWDAWNTHSEGIEHFTTAFWLKKLVQKHELKIIMERGGDLLRGWAPFLRKYYHFLDKHPLLSLGRFWPFYFLTMNYFVLVKKHA